MIKSLPIDFLKSGLLAGLLLLSACGNDEVPNEDRPPEVLFASAEQLLQDADYADAAILFGEVERLYPYSEYAKRSVIMSAIAYQRAGLYEESRVAASRYLDFYPADEDAAYAQYLIALSYYDRIDDVSRDHAVTIDAIRALRTVVEFYPDSEFATSAQLKLDLAFDHLAAKEMEIGRYYMKQGHFGAAINRFRVVVEEYGTTSHTPEALHRLVEANLSLGLDDEALIAAAILGHNFRGSEWYQDSYTLLADRDLASGSPDEGATGWLGEIYRRVIKGEWL